MNLFKRLLWAQGDLKTYISIENSISIFYNHYLRSLYEKSIEYKSHLQKVSNWIGGFEDLSKNKVKATGTIIDNDLYMHLPCGHFAIYLFLVYE